MNQLSFFSFSPLLYRFTIGVFLFLLASPLTMAENYDVETITVEPYVDVIKRTGRVSFKRTLNLSFKSSGFLTKLNVDEGDRFSKEQLLASLDTVDLKAQKNSTYAVLLQAKREVARARKLLDKKLSSQQELDLALTKVETARASYRIAFYNLEKAEIIAPFSGVVIARLTELGELQSPGKIALKVAALTNNVVVSVALTGEEITLIKLHQKVEVNLDYLGRITGTISKIPALADQKSHLFNIEVLLPIEQLEHSFIVGQLAQITIHITTQDLVYQLPISALNGMNDNGFALVALQKNDIFQQQAFAVFKLSNDFIALKAKQGDQPLSVITHGWQQLPLQTQTNEQ